MMELPELDESAFKDLREHLLDQTIQINKYRKVMESGRSQYFGIVRKKSSPPDLSKCSWNDPKLHYLLMKFAREHVDIPFTSIQINDNLKCTAHKNKYTTGNSYIVAFGSYQGGELVIGDKEYNIKHRPVLFDGELECSTKDFTGRRWSLVFHTQESPLKFPAIRKLTDYEAVFRDGMYVIAWYRDGLSTEYLHRKNGLGQSMKKRIKKVLPPAPVKINPKMSEAQNLLLIVQSHRGDNLLER